MATNGQLTKLVSELNGIREANDWTFLQLSQAIEKVTGHGRDEDCWRRIIKGTTTEPQERTLLILEKFLDSVRPTAKRRARRAS